MQKTKISWTEFTWNPVVGCKKVSPGCKNCYAEKMANRVRGMMYIQSSDKSMETWAKYDEVLTMDGKWNSHTYCDESALDKPLHWKKPRKIFVCSMGDLFHESVPFEFIDKVFGAMFCANQHTYQILTKWPDRMAEYIKHLDEVCYEAGDFTCWSKLPNKHIWLGVSAENQEWADKRIPILLQIPAAVRFVSLEPLLGPVDLTKLDNGPVRTNSFSGRQGMMCKPHWNTGKLDWVIIGAESNGAYPGRECKNIWIKNIVNQCESAGVPVFVKQLHWTDGYGKTWLVKDKRHFPIGYPQQYPGE